MPGRDGGADRLADRRLVPLGHRGHQPLVDRPAGHGDHAQESLALLGQRRDLTGERLRQRPRERARCRRVVRPRPAPRRRTDCRRSGRGSARPARHPRRTRGSWRPDGRPRHGPAGRGPAGSVRGIALECGQPRGDRVAVRQPVGPDRQHQQQAVALEIAGEERDEVACPAVDPVQVLEDEHRRRLGSRGRPAGRGRARTGSPGRGPIARRRPVRARRPGAGAIGPMPGSSRPISSRAGPSTDAMRSGGRSRRKVRNASVSGAYGRPSSARSRQPPTSTRAPSLRARPANSSMSRVLPMPASPATTTIPGPPSVARGQPRTERPELGLPADQFRTRYQAHHRASLRVTRLFEVPVASRLRHRPMAPTAAAIDPCISRRTTARHARR